MYESNHEPREFLAEDRDGAVAKACEFFGLSQEELRIAELSSDDVFGLANRRVIVAVPRNRPEPRPDRGDRGDRDRGGRGDRGGRERGGRDRGGRGRGGDRGGRDRGRGRRPESSFEPASESVLPAPEPSEGRVQGEVSELGQFVVGLVERMGLGSFDLRESSEDGLVVVEIRGDAAPRLAGSDGRAVDALQLLIHQAACRLHEEPPRVVLEVEGDSESREERLAQLAARVARRARDSGRSVRLEPMSPRDRRLIHVALRDETDVATMSTGEGRFKQVVVVPEGAPEYDEAVRQAESAAHRGDD